MRKTFRSCAYNNLGIDEGEALCKEPSGASCPLGQGSGFFCGYWVSVSVWIEDQNRKLWSKMHSSHQLLKARLSAQRIEHRIDFQLCHLVVAYFIHAVQFFDGEF